MPPTDWKLIFLQAGSELEDTMVVLCLKNEASIKKILTCCLCSSISVYYNNLDVPIKKLAHEEKYNSKYDHICCQPLSFHTF